MITYQEYEKAVYDWLLAKNNLDSSFTFSTRLNGMKGSELDYFIGTEKSGYFGLTFWSIPIGFPGSAADLIDVFFEQKENGFKFFFEFGQTMSPTDEQNRSALNLIRKIKENISEIGKLTYETTEDLKMFKYILGSPKPRYNNLDDLFIDLEQILNILFPIVEQGIIAESEKNQTFIAHRITPSQFNEIQEKLKTRFSRYEYINEFELNSEVNFETFIQRFKKEDFEIFIAFLSEIMLKFDLNENDERLVFNIHSKRGHLNFTVGQRNCFTLSNNEKRGKFGFLSKEKLFENSVQFEGNHPRPWFSHINELILDKFQKENIFEGIEIELNRSAKSGFRKFNKKEFEEFVLNNQRIPIREDSKKMIDIPLNQILYGPPGTGKTYYTVDKSVSIISQREYIKGNHEANKIIYDKHYKKKNILFTTFHQSMSYEDFIEGIKPKLNDNSDNETSEIKYEISSGIFKTACARAAYNAYKETQIEQIEDIELSDEEIVRQFDSGLYEKAVKTYGKESTPVVLIIDEINRGNVSAIFGELITLIEEDKRIGQKNEIQLTLPYSKNKFSVPPNLYIIGTMNTADRSVEALDTALRRRFSFEEMLPKPYLLKDKGENGTGKVGEIYLEELLIDINDRIEALIDRDHTIGHAFFIDVNSLDSLKNVFANKVIPLLQEYFYGDYAKMEMVIGPDFFNSQKRKKKVTFAIQNEEIEIPTGNYELMNILEPTFNFLSAINRLLNRKIIEVEVN